MVREKDLFWYITAYIANEILKCALQMAQLGRKRSGMMLSPSDPFLLIVHENDQF